jgi:hypothetical protein
MRVYLDESGSIVNGLIANASESVPYFVLDGIGSQRRPSHKGMHKGHQEEEGQKKVSEDLRAEIQ